MSCSLRYLLIVSVAAMVGSATAQDTEAEKKPTEPPEMSAQELAWMKAAEPGPNHERLEYMIGEWDTVVTMADESGAEQTSKGRAKNTWILGKRYVQNQYTGDLAGAPFQGLGYTGYDNIEKTYFSTWMDTFSTGVMVEKGQYDEAKKQFVMTSSYTDPTGAKIRARSTIRIVDKDRHVMTFEHAQEGDETYTKVMEIVYSRAKSAARTENPKAESERG